jgi:hypothetical protein
MVMIMLMGRECVSERRQPTGLWLIPQAIYKHGEPWWNEIKRKKLLLSPTQLSGKTASSHLVKNQEKLGDGND